LLASALRVNRSHEVLCPVDAGFSFFVINSYVSFTAGAYFNDC